MASKLLIEFEGKVFRVKDAETGKRLPYEILDVAILHDPQAGLCTQLTVRGVNVITIEEKPE